MWSQAIIGRGQMEEVALFFTSHSLYDLVVWETSLLCEPSETFVLLPKNLTRYKQILTRTEKWADMGFPSQTELLPPPQFYLWEAQKVEKGITVEVRGGVQNLWYMSNNDGGCQSPLPSSHCINYNLPVSIFSLYISSRLFIRILFSLAFLLNIFFFLHKFLC